MSTNLRLPGYQSQLQTPDAPVLENDVNREDLAQRTYWQNVLTFGVHPDAEDNSAAMQKAVDFCVTHKLNLYAPSGRYFFKSALVNAGFYMPSILGDGIAATVFDFSGCADVAIKITGGSGAISYTKFSHITFYGHNAHPIFRNDGRGGVLWEECMFECAVKSGCVAIEFANLSSGNFTEFCVATRCRFGYNLNRAIKYTRGAGNDSFHASGVQDCIFNVDNPAVEVGAGCGVYNAPLSGHAFSDGESAAWLRVSETAGNANFFGTMCFEGNVILAEGGPAYLIGSVHNGAGHMKLGTASLCTDLSNAGSDYGSIWYPILKPFTRQILAPVNGANLFNGWSVLPVGSDVWVSIEGPNLAIRRLYYCEHNGFGNAGVAALIASGINHNDAGLSSLAVAVDSGGRIVVTLAGLPGVGSFTLSVFVTPRAALGQ